MVLDNLFYRILMSAYTLKLAGNVIRCVKTLHQKKKEKKLVASL